MNTSIHLPFCSINIRNATEHHLEYLKNIYFETDAKSPTVDFTIELDFKQLAPPADFVQLEQSILKTKDGFIIRDSQRKLLSLPLFSATQTTIPLSVDPEFDLYQLFNLVIEPLIIIWSTHHKRLFLHASGVSVNKQAYLFAAWQNTGKTQSVLQLTKDRAVSFVGDDFCVVSEKRVYVYPKSINLFSYNFLNSPSVFAKIPGSTKLRIKTALFAQRILRRLSLLFPFPLSKIFFRISELAEIASNFRVSPQQLGTSVSDSVTIHSTYLIEKTEATEASKTPERMSVGVTTTKLLAIIEYELRDFFSLYKQYLYCYPDRPNAIIDSFSTSYQALIRKNIQSMTAIPFSVKSDLKKYLKSSI